MPTKIAPTKAEPPHNITLIDTPQGRLVDGTVCLFTLSGSSTQLTLRTKKPFKTAKGRIPADIGGGTYDVSFKQPDGTTVDIGSFVVKGEVTDVEPSIAPTSGPIGTGITVTDPEGRMASNSVMVITEEGGDPEAGTPISDAEFGGDGKTATGTIPGTLNSANFGVTVHPDSPSELPYFNALDFQVT